MEDSAYESLMLAVYILIFITATSLTIFLFSTTVSFADKAYEYGKVATGDSVIETLTAPEYNTITGAELLTYYYNYKSNDKYGTGPEIKYNFESIGAIDVNKTYTLIYKSVGSDNIPVIDVKEIASEVTGGEDPIVVDKTPTISGISITNYNLSGKVLPGTLLEFSAQAYVKYSPLTNSIKSYIWKIDYSSEDGRADYTFTQNKTSGELLESNAGDNLKFYKGTNTVSVYAQDILGNKSQIKSIDIVAGYNDPVINSVKEENKLVEDYGNVDINSPGGASLNIVTDASSKNLGGYISKYDYFVNDVLVQSGSNNKLSKVFAPGNYNTKIVVHDSMSGTAERSFSFTVNQIHAPTITCNNTDVTTYNSVAIATDTINLTFKATLEDRYSINKYVWNIDGNTYETNAANGISLNYGIASHSISVYGVTAQGLISQTRTFNFIVKEDFVPFEQSYSVNGSYHTVTLPAGKYVFELWGAQGGNGAGGYGGYTKGQLNLTTSTTFYLYVGSSAGYNGGGSSRLSYSVGGGATDVRLVSGSWNGYTSRKSRIMVAGGGGGNGGTTIRSLGGAGGELTGYTGADNYGDPGTGGTQISGGLAGRLNGYGATNGSVGLGGNGESVQPGVVATIGSGTVGSSAGAGGGGYYGGGGASCDYSNYNDLDDSGGGGGSSFISGYAGCNAISSINVHTGQPNHYSGLVFTYSSMISGNNLGDGKAKITRVR